MMFENLIYFIFLFIKNMSPLQSLVDLAGSESAAKAMTTRSREFPDAADLYVDDDESGLRRGEGGFINKSLLALATVIHRLSSKKQS